MKFLFLQNYCIPNCTFRIEAPIALTRRSWRIVCRSSAFKVEHIYVLSTGTLLPDRAMRLFLLYFLSMSMAQKIIPVRRLLQLMSGFASITGKLHYENLENVQRFNFRVWRTHFWQSVQKDVRWSVGTVSKVHEVLQRYARIYFMIKGQ